MTLSRGQVRSIDLDDLDRQIREFVDRDLSGIVDDYDQPMPAASVRPAVGDDAFDENEPDGEDELAQEFAESVDVVSDDDDDIEGIPDTSDSALGRRARRRSFRTGALVYVAAFVLMALGAAAAVVLRPGPTGRLGSEAPVATGVQAPVQPATIAVGDQTKAISVIGAVGLPAKPDQPIVVSTIRPAPPANAVAQAPPTMLVALAKVSPPDPQGVVLSSLFGTPHRVVTESIKPDAAVASEDKPETIPLPPSKRRALALTATTALERAADTTGSIKPATAKGEVTHAKSFDAGANTADASSFLVQLGSSPSKSEALATLAQLRKQFPDVLRGGSVRRSDQGSMGVFYRVQVGPLSRDAADKVCSQLKSSGASCIVTRT